MPLGCDCFPGCWGKHSEFWPTLHFETRAEHDEARKFVIRNSAYFPYGSYVSVGVDLRLETQEQADIVEEYITGGL